MAIWPLLKQNTQSYEVLDLRKSPGGMAAITAAHGRRPKPAEPTIYRGLQLQQQPQALS